MSQEEDSESTDNGNKTGESTQSWLDKSRREILGATAGTGVSLIGLHETTRIGAARSDSGKDAVDYTAEYRVRDGPIGVPSPDNRPEMVEVRKTASKDRWARVKAAHNAARRLHQSLQNRFDIPTTSVGVLKEDRQGELQVTVLRALPKGADESKLPTSFDEIRRAVPDQIRGAANTPDGTAERAFDTNTKKWSLNPHYADGPFRPIPGGCKIEADVDTPPLEGTATQPVWSEDLGEYQMLTAGHVVDNRGKDVWQPGADCAASECNSPVGTIYQYEWDTTEKIIDVNGDGDPDQVIVTNLDAGTVSLETDTNYSYHIAADGGGNDEDIVGYWSFDEIQMAQENNQFIEVQGYISGRKSGRIMYTDSTYGWVVCDVSLNNGDSGGPYFNVGADNNAAMIGTHSSGVDYSNDEGSFDDAASFNAIGPILNGLNLSFV